MSDKKNKSIEATEIPWNQGVIMICSKCSRKLEGRDSKFKDTADYFKGELKSLARARGHGKNMRVITTSCLDICPDERVAIALIGTQAKENIKAITVTQDAEPEKIFDALMGLS